MTRAIISSSDNPRFKQLKKLADSARERRKLGATLLDGVHLLAACADAGVVPSEIILRSGVVPSEIAQVLARFADVPRLVLSATLFDALAPVEHSSGVLARLSIPAAPAGEQHFCVLLEDIQDPGNVGAIARSAAAAGVDTLYLSKGCAEAWSPKAMRAGMGAQFRLAVHEHADLVAVARGFDGVVVASVPDAQKNLFTTRLRRPLALLFGNEGAGLTPDLLAYATTQVRIPMPGGAESLNVGAAAAICLFEVVRQNAAA